MNRVRLVFSRACSDPNPDHPRWDERRIWSACRAIIEAGRLDPGPILGPIVAFDDLLDVYQGIASDPGAGIKLAVVYPRSDGA
jgi:hypothetical protein